jgi:histidine triad (HIT) family protein
MKTIFEKIINREMNATIIYEDKDVIAILDINPKAHGHTLVIPKIKSINMLDIDDCDLTILIVKANSVAKKIIKQIKEPGYQIHINSSKEAGQEIFYTHIHIIPTKKNKKRIKINKILDLN